MTKPRELPTQERLRELFDYDEHTGRLTWRCRDDIDPGFNGRFAGKLAGAQSGMAWRVMVDHRQLAYHRVIWKLVYGSEPPPEIDHINGNTSDNRLCNLRAANRWLNAKNRGDTKGRKLPKGVRKCGGVYQASIRHNGANKSLGYYSTVELAQAAYVIAAHDIWGEWARDVPPISAELRERVERDREKKKRGPMSVAQRAKFSAMRKGRKLGPQTPEHIANNVAARLGGKRGPQSTEHIEKCRQSRIGKKKRPWTLEERAAISVRQLGKKRGPHSAATRAAMVAAWVRRRADADIVEGGH
jgi:hypothetical protein